MGTPTAKRKQIRRESPIVEGLRKITHGWITLGSMTIIKPCDNYRERVATQTKNSAFFPTFYSFSSTKLRKHLPIWRFLCTFAPECWRGEAGPAFRQESEGEALKGFELSWNRQPRFNEVLVLSCTSFLNISQRSGLYTRGRTSRFLMIAHSGLLSWKKGSDEPRVTGWQLTSYGNKLLQADRERNSKSYERNHFNF